MNKQHYYNTELRWTGNQGSGTKDYKSFERSYTITIRNKPEIQGSSDPAFRGDPEKHNPEELFLSSLSSCHMLWYLHLCAVNGVCVIDYSDFATGTMEETADGSGRFTQVILEPKVVVTEESMYDKAMALHRKANEKCFIANSVNFKVKHQASCQIRTKD